MVHKYVSFYQELLTMRSTIFNHNNFGHWNIAHQTQFWHYQNKERLQKAESQTSSNYGVWVDFLPYCYFRKILTDSVTLVFTTLPNHDMEKKILRESTSHPWLLISHVNRWPSICQNFNSCDIWIYKIQEGPQDPIKQG